MARGVLPGPVVAEGLLELPILPSHSTGFSAGRCAATQPGAQGPLSTQRPVLTGCAADHRRPRPVPPGCPSCPQGGWSHCPLSMAPGGLSYCSKLLTYPHGHHICLHHHHPHPHQLSAHRTPAASPARLTALHHNPSPWQQHQHPSVCPPGQPELRASHARGAARLTWEGGVVGIRLPRQEAGPGPWEEPLAGCPQAEGTEHAVRDSSARRAGRGPRDQVLMPASVGAAVPWRWWSGFS